MRIAARLVSACLLACLAFLVLPAPGALAAPRPAVIRLAANDAPATTTTKAPSAPSGPDLEQKQADADAKVGKRKLVVGVIALVLLIIVVWGHRIRWKRRKKDTENTG